MTVGNVFGSGGGEYLNESLTLKNDDKILGYAENSEAVSKSGVGYEVEKQEYRKNHFLSLPDSCLDT